MKGIYRAVAVSRDMWEHIGLIGTQGLDISVKGLRIDYCLGFSVHESLCAQFTGTRMWGAF